MPIDFYERISRPTVEERLEARMTSRMTPEQRVEARMLAGRNRRAAEARPEREGTTAEGLASGMRRERQGLRSVTPDPGEGAQPASWYRDAVARGERERIRRGRIGAPTRADEIAADATEAIVGKRRDPTESDVPIGIGEDQRLPDKPDINAMSVSELKKIVGD